MTTLRVVITSTSILLGSQIYSQTPPELEASSKVIVDDGYDHAEMSVNAWGGSHGLLFGAKVNYSGIGNIWDPNNTIYAQNSGQYNYSAFSLGYIANGGVFSFYDGGLSTGVGNAITWNPVMSIVRGGKIGIGTTNPAAKFDVISGNARMQFSPDNSDKGDIFRMFNANGQLFSVCSFVPATGNLITDLGVNYSINGGDGTGTYARIGTKKAPMLRLNAEDGSIGIYGESGSGSDFRTPTLNLGVYVNSSGHVGIGTTTDHSGYKLSVNGNVLAQKIKGTQTGWPDYVFHSGYRFPSLNDVEVYIKQNNHLPDVPSAAEVEKDGLDLGDNQATLLKKIEELTLYLIEQNNQIKILIEQNKKLEDRMREMEALKK